MTRFSVRVHETLVDDAAGRRVSHSSGLRVVDEESLRHSLVDEDYRNLWLSRSQVGH